MENNSITNLNEWTDVKIFRDTVHQYIEMPKVYVRYLIDTHEMQRIKDVAQSGLRSVFNAATHDRFSHSLGVYHLGKKAFKSLKKNIVNIVEKEYYHDRSNVPQLLRDLFKSEWEAYEQDLGIWEVLYQIACILHDIGHPAMSHTLEFLYDDVYMDISRKRSYAGVSYEEYERFQKLQEQYECGGRTKFELFLGERLFGNREQKVKGNPHERMSAYYIVSGFILDETLGVYIPEKDTLAWNIKMLICSYYRYIGEEVPDEEDLDKKSDKEIRVIKDWNTRIYDYTCFICRMIIGQEYECHESEGVTCIQNSVKNAIIGLLNGKIDADSLDYITRNSYSAGYDTNSIDVNRLSTSYSVRFQNNMFQPVFEKNAISVLEGFISARNFEPNWLYSHHKIVYNIDVLYKYMFHCAVKMLYMEDLDEWSQIILHNFFGRDEDIEDNSFYKKHIGKDEAAERSLSEFQQKEIFGKLKKLYISPDQDVESKLMQLEVSSVDDIDAKTRVMGIKEELKNYGNEKYDQEDRRLEQKLDELCSGNYELMSLKDEILDYTKSIQLFKGVCNRILNRPSGDIQEAAFRPILMNTKLFLAKLFLDETVSITDDEKKELYDFLKALLKRYGELRDIRNLYFSYILSPTRSFENKRFLFYRSNDSDIDALFKSWYYRLKSKDTKLPLTPIERTYLNLGKEYFERKYKTSLWKSYQEYKIFIDGIAKRINMEPSKINEYFLYIIQKWGKALRFHEDRKNPANSQFENQTIYIHEKDDGFWDEIVKGSEKNEFKELFLDFESVNFIIKVHVMKYKDFRNSVKVAFKEKVFPLGDIIELVEMKDKKFPFIFIDLSDMSGDDKGQERRRYLDLLEDRLAKYCLHKLGENSITKREAIDDIMVNNEGKIFRDVVHGDIVIPRKFVPLIETSAFQRLRRIKQLSTADMVFPNAMHTRFAHSIGTFHVMTLIVKHFKKIFQELGVVYYKMDIDALLAAALLHDIGHGPYSHNFERLFGERKKHEEWGADIIRNDEEIRNALRVGFPEYENRLEEFIGKITSYVVTDEAKDVSSGFLGFQTIFKSLLSSELDADRMDYLLRDSFNTGLGYGKVDIGMIIRGMRVIEIGNKFYVCIVENFLSYIEQFIFGRYKMYDSVYYNAYKVFSEALVLKILKYARNNNSLLDSNISAILNNQLDLEEYLALDDSYINGLFSQWQHSKDLILSKMCKAFLTRSGYERLYIMNQTVEDLHMFKSELDSAIQRYFPGFDKKVDDLYSFVFTKREFSAYDPKTDESKIWIQTNEGLVRDFAELSPMFLDSGKKISWSTQKVFIYYSKELFEIELDSMKESVDFQKMKVALLAHIDQMISSSNLRNHIEIEEKYACSAEELDAVKKMLDDENGELWQSYKIQIPVETDKNAEQEDIYYDTDDLRVAMNNCSFRCRKKPDGRYKITIKAPTPVTGFDKESQVARFEYEKEISNNDVTEAIDFIRMTFKDVFPNEMIGLTKENFDSLFKPKLTVKNHRSKYMVSNLEDERGFRFSVCLDRVTFWHESKGEKKDYQIEVELESDYMHRVSMKFFTKKIEQKLANVKHEQYSKYIKGLDMLGIYHPDR